MYIDVKLLYVVCGLVLSIYIYIYYPKKGRTPKVVVRFYLLRFIFFLFVFNTATYSNGHLRKVPEKAR